MCEHQLILAVVISEATTGILHHNRSKTTVDKLLASMKSLSDKQKISQTKRLDQLEKDIYASTKESTQCFIKHLKRVWIYEFNQKDNNKQFSFNEEVND